jgi:5'-nucleotidase
MNIRQLSRALALSALAVAAAPSSALEILLCNDDGFTSANTHALYERLKDAGHDVIVSAPADNQSGRGGFVSFLQPIPPVPESYVDMYTMKTVVPRIIKVYPDLAGAPGVGDDPDNADFSYVWGSPVMACLYGIDVKAPARFGGRPDLVISGPNEGSNTGHINVSSGTVNNVYYAINRRLPAIAVSDSVSTSVEYTALTPESRAYEVADIVVRLVGALADNAGTTGSRLLPKGAGLNVNIPGFAAGAGADLPFVFTRMGTATTYSPAFYEDLGDSTFGAALGLAGKTGISVVSAGTELPGGTRIPVDSRDDSEGNVVASGAGVSVTVIEGVPEARPQAVDKVQASLGALVE